MPGHSLAQLRTSNLRAVTALLGSGGPQSRADLARGSGLSRTTVSSLVTELLEAGLVVETEDRGTPYKGGSGRPPLLVALAPAPGGVAGVDIGHGHVRVAVSDRSAQVLAEVETLDRRRPPRRRDARHRRRPGPPGGRRGGHPRRRAAHGRALRARADRPALGPGRPGGPARLARARPRRRARAPARAARRRRQRRQPRRDGRAPARRRARRADLLYVKLASGVGAGLVLGGRLHRGVAGLAGEIGHVLAREDGDVCRCGSRGCLETEVSTRRLLDLLRPVYDGTSTWPACWRWTPQAETAVRRVLTDAGHTVGRVLAGLCTTLNPRDGRGRRLARRLTDAGRGDPRRRRPLRPPRGRRIGEVVSGKFGGRAELIGSLALAISRAVEVA